MGELQYNSDKLKQLHEQKRQLMKQLIKANVMTLKPLLEKFLNLDLECDDLQELINDDYAMFMQDFEE